MSVYAPEKEGFTFTSEIDSFMRKREMGRGGGGGERGRRERGRKKREGQLVFLWGAKRGGGYIF